MSNLSFKDFALAKGFKLPVSMRAVATSLGMTAPPVSLRAMISTAAPFVPASPGTLAVGSGETAFTWYDQATPPFWILSPTIPLRAATSFEFKLWKSSSAGDNTLVQDTVLALSQVLLTNQTMYYVAGALAGSYVYQIIAINEFGTASTPLLTAQLSIPPAAPNIDVTQSGQNLYRVNGTGFQNWNGQSLLLDVDGGITWAHGTQTLVSISQGGFSTNVSTTNLCATVGSKGALRFYVSIQGQVGAVSNVVTGYSCP
jgi:hypothetical protein